MAGFVSVLAPLFLVFAGHSDFTPEDRTAVPFFGTEAQCWEQAHHIDDVMSGRSTWNLGRAMSNTNQHAFCINTYWSPSQYPLEQVTPHYYAGDAGKAPTVVIAPTPGVHDELPVVSRTPSEDSHH